MNTYVHTFKVGQSISGDSNRLDVRCWLKADGYEPRWECPLIAQKQPERAGRWRAESAAAWSATGASNPGIGNNFEAASLRRWSGGFGVQNRLSNDIYNSEHAVDNNNNFDFVVFELDRAVNLSSVTMNEYNTGDSDITVWVGNTDSDFSTQLDLAGMGFSDLDNTFARSENYVNGGSPRTAYFSENENLFGNVIIVAATILPTYNGLKDYFKIKKLAGGYNDTPPPSTQISEPGTLAVIAFGLAGIGYVRRRKKTA